jgi:hypothetical protein
LCNSNETYIWSKAIGEREWAIKLFSSIDEEEKVWLEREFEEMEVWEVMKGMEGDKAPGPDGFTMLFFNLVGQW